ncbi:MAG TPA: TetR/AcrR family transcriptional regulator [Clostridiales bacterium]|nr:TetR/AcrR family transcriptional regulator [Clostridiales bacterium]
MTENRRENLLNAATDVFSQYGFHGAKMEDIAKKAEIGKGTIYGYFDSKRSLFYEMIKYRIEEYRKGLDSALNIDGSLEEKLYAQYVFHEAYLNKYIDITQIIMREKEVLPKELIMELAAEMDKLFSRMKRAVEEAIHRKELRKDLDPKLAAIIIIGSIGQFYGQKIYCQKKGHDNIDLMDLIDTVLKGLR